MRTTLLVLLLVCGGCSMAPAKDLGDLYVEHARCLEADAIGCEAIWQAIEQRERIAAKREARSPCPAGAVSVRNGSGSDACVSQSHAQTLLSQMLR